MLVISQKILDKLTDKHGVSEREVEQCFENRTGNLLEDTREDHKSDPPTLWFVAYTNKNRLLKVCFIEDGGKIFIRTCFEADQKAIDIYRKYGKPADF